jgi:hypothetical protein
MNQTEKLKSIYPDGYPRETRKQRFVFGGHNEQHTVQEAIIDRVGTFVSQFSTLEVVLGGSHSSIMCGCDKYHWKMACGAVNFVTFVNYSKPLPRVQGFESRLYTQMIVAVGPNWCFSIQLLYKNRFFVALKDAGHMSDLTLGTPAKSEAC